MSEELARGLQERLISHVLDARIGERLASGEYTPETIRRDPLNSAEAADRIALHVSNLIRLAINSFPETERSKLGLELAHRLVELLAEGSTAVVRYDAPVQHDPLLRAVLRRLPDGTAERLPSPMIPLLDTALLTNASDEPTLSAQIHAEVASADRIDLVMAFIRRSGIRPFLSSLETHCQAGRPLRILTTTYTGSTEPAALDELVRLGAEIRVSYDHSRTRLHAKSWLFHRDSGASTAYIGSSNLTLSAQITGKEWNLRVAKARNPDVVRKFEAVFASYWDGREFESYDRARFEAAIAAARPDPPRIPYAPIDVEPRPFQNALLAQIEEARERGRNRNLLVAATGTGKTVMAAVDFRRLSRDRRRTSLLFVAHREELLDQAIATFRQVLNHPSFGERWVGGDRPRHFEHVFASIQSLASNGLEALEPAHFDVVIVDEFHHAAARSYATLLERVRPWQLLGLTATPERADGRSVLDWFDGRIAAELRLWDAIEDEHLVPFEYFGVADNTDLRAVPWRRGRGYDVDGLTNVYTADDAWTRLVLGQLVRRVDDPRTMRALGFCVSVAHAQFMARKFSEAGIRAAAVWGADRDVDSRVRSLKELATGELNVVFSVDLLNEGIDVPNVDTLLLLRPTESPTLFLQQLGRGLRRAVGKRVCTVLDFIGNHHREFRFDRRFRALLGGSIAELTNQVEQQFPRLPSGCHFELDPVASAVVLRSLRDAIPSRFREKADELRRLSSGTTRTRLLEFLAKAQLEVEEIYSGGRSWSDLIEAAELPVAQAGEHEKALRRACGRLLHVDDHERVESWRTLLTDRDPTAALADESGRRVVRMLLATLADSIPALGTTLAEQVARLLDHRQICTELLELLEVLDEAIHLRHPALEGRHVGIPLRLHARYTRGEILSAFATGTTARAPEWREGVRWLKEFQTDLFAFTIDKSAGHFSPTTRYRDYAISRELIHWESQSTTSSESPTGLRYRHHEAEGSSILLFARRSNLERAFWCLGPARYVRHESERPMAIVWRLTHPLPEELFASMAAAVA